MRFSLALLALLMIAVWSPEALSGPADFEAPVDVRIEGYDGHAMEPFATRDGAFLFFNTRNRPEDQTDIHFAARVSETSFRYLGPLEGANSDALDGVPSMDRAGRFVFVSPRDYGATRNTLWEGRFDGESVREVRPLRGDVSRGKPLWLNIDAEISADGEALYFVENRWRLFGGGLKSANIFAAYRGEDGAFLRAEDAEALFTAVNSKLLEYAPAISGDQLTLYFTRADRAALRRGEADGFAILVSTRPSRDAPFGAPERIEAITGYAEGPSLTPNECGVYFHRLAGDRFVIQLARRKACG